MNRAALEAQLAELPIAQYVFFQTPELEFSPRIRAVCEQECPRYGKSWACPPAVGSTEDCQKRCLEYPDGLLIATLAEVADISDMTQTLATRPTHEEVTHQAAALLKEQGLEVMGLSSDSCALCRRCTYPDAPCRHPERMFPCVESHGIVVTALAEKYGIEYQYGGNIVTWFSLLLYREKSR